MTDVEAEFTVIWKCRLEIDAAAAEGRLGSLCLPRNTVDMPHVQPVYRDDLGEPVFIGFFVWTASAAGQVAEVRRLFGNSRAEELVEILAPTQPFLPPDIANKLIAEMNDAAV